MGIFRILEIVMFVSGVINEVTPYTPSSFNVADFHVNRKWVPLYCTQWIMVFYCQNGLLKLYNSSN